MRCVVILLLTSCFTCPSACSFWFLSRMKLSSVGSEGDPNGNFKFGGETGHSRIMCDLIPGLTRKQRRICEHQPDLMKTVFQGAQIAISECQMQFRNQRWNCSTVEKSGRDVSSVMLKLGSREAAFVYAISSAGVVHSIARSCADGTLKECSCGRTKRGGGKDKKGPFLWGGCSDNVRFAAHFARRFIDARDRKNRDPTAFMNLHNYRAGRRAVRRALRTVCKCHGVSGSCATRTCWKALDHFHVVGSRLRRKYTGAVQVRTDQNGKNLVAISSRRHRDDVRSNGIKPAKVGSKYKKLSPAIRKTDLVFFEPSPDYCVMDYSKGSLGTAGRRCNVTSKGPDSCDIMCCGRGYDTTTETVTKNCQCRFVWCCKVECKTCTETMEIFTCKPYRSRLDLNNSLGNMYSPYYRRFHKFY